MRSAEVRTRPAKWLSRAVRSTALVLASLWFQPLLAAGFDAQYEVMAGHFDQDQQLDLYLRYKPVLTFVSVDDIQVPIPLTKRQTAEFVLRRNGSGYQVLPLSQSDRQLVIGWPAAAAQILTGDYNADGVADILVNSSSSAIPSVIVFAGPTASAMPIGARVYDSGMARFFRDVKGWLNNPSQYFANAWYWDTEYVPWPVHVYDCGDGYPVQYLEGDPNEIDAMFDCYYLYSYYTSVPVPVQRFDSRNFSPDAYNLTTYFPADASTSLTGFSLSPQAQAELVPQISNYFGVPFGLPEHRDGSAPLGGYWPVIKHLAQANSALVFMAMASSANEPVLDERDVWVTRARNALQSLLRALPRGPAEGVTRVQYNEFEVLKILVNLIKLASAQNTDFMTDPDFGPERDMLARVLAQHADEYTSKWFFHETAEASKIFRRGGFALDGEAYLRAQSVAHNETWAEQGTRPWDYYHPTVVRNPDYAGRFTDPRYDRARNDYVN